MWSQLWMCDGCVCVWWMCDECVWWIQATGVWLIQATGVATGVTVCMRSTLMVFVSDAAAASMSIAVAVGVGVNMWWVAICLLMITNNAAGCQRSHLGNRCGCVMRSTLLVLICSAAASMSTITVATGVNNWQFAICTSVSAAAAACKKSNGDVCPPLKKSVIKTIRLISQDLYNRDAWYTCTGTVDAYWQFNLKPWDISAGALLIEEAGGTISTSDGT